MAKKFLAFSLIFMFLFSLFIVSVHAETYIKLKRVTVGEKSGAWLEDWAYRREITVNSSKVDGDLTDFATLIYLSGSSGETDVDVTSIFDEVGSNSNALAFTSSDATTRLYYEVEYWNATSETAYVWVKVPSIANSPDTKIYIYYDSTKDGSAYHVAEQVWESSAVMVQHLEEASGTVYDSTSNNNDGTVYGATYGATGQIDNALSFDGVDDYVECPSFNLNSFTISLWIYRETDSGTRERLVCKSGASTFDIWAQIELTDKMDLGFYDEDGHVNYLIGSTSITLNTGHLLTYVFALNDKIYLYLDGGLDKSGFTGGDALKTPRTSTLKWWVGRLTSTYKFDGIIDEVRIYNQAKPAAWIKADYYSGIDSLISYGSEEGTLLYPENIVVSKLTENYDVYLYNATTLVCNATVGSNGNATLTLPLAYREDTFEGRFKVYDTNDNAVFQEIFPDTRGGDEYEALQETTNIWILGFMFGAMGFVFGVFALIYMRNKKEKEEGEQLYIDEEEYYTEEESWQ